MDIRNSKSAIAFLSRKCKSNFSKAYYQESPGKLKIFESLEVSLKDEDLKYLTFFPNIQEIRITGKGITNEGLRYFKGFHNLKKLSLIGTCVTGTGFRYLRDCTGLTHIELEGSPITDDGCGYLSDIDLRKGIEELNLSSTTITDDALKYMSRHRMTGGLSLKNDRITDRGIRYLEGQDIQEIVLSGTRVTKEGYAWFDLNFPDTDIY